MASNGRLQIDRQSFKDWQDLIMSGFISAERDRQFSLFNRKRAAENQHEPNRFRNMKEELDMN
jgi:hypothetical protein